MSHSTMSVNSETPSDLKHDNNSNSASLEGDASQEQVIGEITFTDLENIMSDNAINLSFDDIPKGISGMKPIETSSVLEEADDQSVPNTTMPSTFNTTSISSTEQSLEETKKSVKKARLKSCIIKLTELSNSEREKWARSENSSPKLNNSIDSTESLNSSGSRYNMRS